MTLSGKRPGMDDEMAFSDPSSCNFLPRCLANIIPQQSQLTLPLKTDFQQHIQNVIELVSRLTLVLPSPNPSRQKR